MTYEELVKQVKDIAEKTDAGRIQEHVAFQFNIEGEAAGAFYLEVKDGRAVVEPYEYYDRDVLVRCTAETLLKIVEGKLDPILAYTIKKIKVEGDLGKALLLKEVVGKKK
ncbi:MAG: SCP2 sterol-binding domain-containing protein [Lachnospiraceae bacterium]|nr:SCP2 sterol-binding domain-containing protein [Lachnospiraceae bacterium]